MRQPFQAYHPDVHASRAPHAPTAPVEPARPRQWAVNRRSRRRIAIVATVMAASLAATTLLVAGLEGASIGIADASPVYLLAVVVVGSAFGGGPAILTAVAAFALYDVLFTAPQFSLVVADPREWLDLLLFLVVALAIGRLVAGQRRHAEELAQSAVEANALFALSRLLATAPSTEAAADGIAARLMADAGLYRAVIRVGTGPTERVLADTATSREPLPATAIVTSLVRNPGDEPARWVRTHQGSTGGATTTPADLDVYRVRIEIDGAVLGTLVAIRPRADGPPERSQTRILALAADQLATSLRRDELRRTATALDVAREADVLKSALIDAVSHDLRTPLASIRATAGGLADATVVWSDAERRSAASVIDAEATRLDRLVHGLLELGRIASGDVNPDLEPHEPWAIVTPAIDRLRPAFGARDVQVDVPDELPPVLADASLVDSIVTNLLENALRHTPASAPIRIDARAADGELCLTVADGGPGIAADRLDRLFERFQPSSPARAGQPVTSRPGLGIGLSIVRGLVAAMGGTVTASRSELGGLAVSLRLRLVV